MSKKRQRNVKKETKSGKKSTNGERDKKASKREEREKATKGEKKEKEIEKRST